MRAGTAISLRRTVAVVALARLGPVVVAAARVRLNAMTASTAGHRHLAADLGDGRADGVGHSESLRVVHRAQVGQLGGQQHRAAALGTRS